MSAVMNLEVPRDVLESARLSAAKLKLRQNPMQSPFAPRR